MRKLGVGISIEEEILKFLLSVPFKMMAMLLKQRAWVCGQVALDMLAL